MELTTIESTGTTAAATPANRLVEPSANTLAAVPTVTSVLIQGAQRACELEPTVRQQCVRSSHAPTPSIVGSAQPVSWEDEEVTIPGAEVWQELVRMLVAREAAKLMHPAGRARV
jgi:hypothetical protein